MRSQATDKNALQVKSGEVRGIWGSYLRVAFLKIREMFNNDRIRCYLGEEEERGSE